ncbi:MAG: MerR family transcriptional regulator [Lachnospiraceae bacterium]|nr:MerR family transcriptional regulator [Lachnospiraceae bacterium]
MSETCYSISEASQKLDVEAHVLRYWEEELNLKVPRNELGHRYYTEDLISTIQRIRDLRKLGCSLKEVRDSLKNDEMADAGVTSLAEAEAAAGIAEGPPDKLAQFQEIMVGIFTEAMNRSSGRLTKDISDQVSDQVVKEVDYLMQLQSEKQEDHFRHLDETLRAYQKSQKGRAEAAITQVPTTSAAARKKFHILKKHS